MARTSPDRYPQVCIGQYRRFSVPAKASWPGLSGPPVHMASIRAVPVRRGHSRPGLCTGGPDEPGHDGERIACPTKSGKPINRHGLSDTCLWVTIRDEPGHDGAGRESTQPTYRNKILDAISAASTTGDGNKKKNAVNNPVAATTNDSAGGRRSNASAGGSKYITLMMRM